MLCRRGVLADALPPWLLAFPVDAVTEPPNYTRLSKKIIQRQDNLTNLSPYNPVVRKISTDFKPFA
jgi:hypothetical protein